MKKVFLFLSRNRNHPALRFIRRVTLFFYYAFENKNNDHYTNGEFWLMSRIRKIKPRIVFDVGANVGKWSLEASRILGRTNVYSFEPIPAIFDELVANTLHETSIRKFNVALAEKSQELSFNFYPRARLFNSIYNHFKGGEAIIVKSAAINGDEFCESNGIKVIDFLKIDVEGSEHLVLRGLEKMLETHNIRAVQFEYGIFSIESKFLLKDYFAFFERYSYTVGKIYPNHIDFKPYSWELENFIGPNFLAIRKDDEELLQVLKVK